MPAAATRLFAIFLALWLWLPASARADRYDDEARRLVQRMTLEEKVGQMTQISVTLVSKDGDTTGRHALDPARLREALITYHVGSIMNEGQGAYSLAHWREIITEIQDVATRETRLKIPVLYGIDAIHGATFTEGATLFPQPLALAATWNLDLARQAGAITAREVRASGIPWDFYPVLDVGRQPLWPRFWETFGEDTFLVTEFGKSYIEGLQGGNYGFPGQVAACLKHYVGYSFPFNGFDRTPACMSERTLRQVFLPPFAAGVRAGVPTVMANSSELDGIPGHANRHLLTEVLKGELGFKGFVVSDFKDVKRLYSRDQVADSPEAAVALAVNAGVDMSMVPNDFSFYRLLLRGVRDKKVSVARIDDAVRRILAVKLRMGLFAPGGAYPAPGLDREFASPAHEAANLKTARESIILLKNERHLLPLAKTGIKVLVTGPTANLLSALNGGWTITWQGDNEARYPKDKPTVLAAIKAKLGAANVLFTPGADFDRTLDLTQATRLAKEADCVVVCLGEKAYCETWGNITDLDLEPAQIQLAQAMIKTGKPVILVLLEGRPRVIAPVVDQSQAILLGFLPGMEGGRAIADVLFGEVNPSAKLPCTYPKAPNGFVTYDHKPLEEWDLNRYDPQFPFGFGLSYTTFAYRDLHLATDKLRQGKNQTVSVRVKNTGDRPGQEVVQLYLQDEFGSVSRPVRELKGFRKLALQPGEERELTFTLTPRDLSFIGVNDRRIVEPGVFKVMVGPLNKEFTLQ